MTKPLLLLLSFFLSQIARGESSALVHEMSAEQHTQAICERALTKREKIGLIRAAYQRINHGQNGYQTVTLPLEDASTEGGEAIAYFDGGALVKLVKIYYHEMGKRSLEYYIDDGDLRFVFDMAVYYNAPVASEYFDRHLSRLEEQRYYLFCGDMIEWLDTDKRPVPPNSSAFGEMASLWQREALEIQLLQRGN